MKTKDDYKIIDFIKAKKSNPIEPENPWDVEFESSDKRFAIADNDGNIIDDAQGYGYKSKKKAYLALNYKYLGGRNKAKENESNYKKWIKSDKIHSDIIDEFNDCMEMNLKEIAIGDITIDEIWKSLEKEYNIQIPDFVKKQALK